MGTGAEILGSTNTRALQLKYSCNVKNIVCRCVCSLNNPSSGQTINLTGVTITGASENYGVVTGYGNSTTINLTNCKITGCTGSFARVKCAGQNTSIVLDGCEIEHRVVLHHDSYMKYIYLKNRNKLGAIGAISTSDSRCRGRVRFYANSITEFSVSITLAKVLEFTTNSDASASVGTLTNGEWVEGGTCAVVLSGVTHHISGTGTFINKNGTGEWTDFTIID